MKITDRQNKKWQSFGKPSGYISSLGKPLRGLTKDVSMFIEKVDFTKFETHFFAQTMKKIKGYNKHQRRLNWRNK